MRRFKGGATRNNDENKNDYDGFLSSMVLNKYDQFLERENQIAWASGLFEGEGCVFKATTKNKHARLEIKLTDEDVLQRFLKIVGYGKIYGSYWAKKSTKPYWSWQCNKDQETIEVLKLLYPYLGTRRKNRVKEICSIERLAEINAMPPLVIKAFGDYMTKHRKQADGKLRPSDNWKKGIPQEAYFQSAWRHFLDVYLHHKGYNDKTTENLEDSLCALIFNIMGYLHELLKNKLLKDKK